MARFTDEHVGSDLEGVEHRSARRTANRLRAADANIETDAQGLAEFACECTKGDCERTVRVPLYVYQRLLAADNQYLLQAGHHAFEHYRTIVSLGLVRIEENA